MLSCRNLQLSRTLSSSSDQPKAVLLDCYCASSATRNDHTVSNTKPGLVVAPHLPLRTFRFSILAAGLPHTRPARAPTEATSRTGPAQFSAGSPQHGLRRMTSRFPSRLCRANAHELRLLAKHSCWGLRANASFHMSGFDIYGLSRSEFAAGRTSACNFAPSL